MSVIEIDSVKYHFNNDFNNYNIRNYLKIMDILNEREIVKIKNAFGLDETRYLDRKEESEKFKRQKKEKILNFLIPNLPKWVFELKEKRFSQLFTLVENNLIVEVEFDDLKSITYGDWFKLADIDGNELFCPKYHSLSFQEFVDMDNDVCVQDTPTILALLLRLDKSKNYDKYHRDLSLKDKNDFLNGISVKKSYKLLEYYTTFLKDVKETYTFLWGDHNLPKTSRTDNYEEFCKIAGWEHTICILAEKQIFGKLSEVRNQPFFEVLSYLNIKKGAEIAEAKDYQLNQYKNGSII